MARSVAIAQWSATSFVPDATSLPALAKASQGCRACPLWEHATQTVFGEGARSSSFMLIGEQPGDHEDGQGHPSVGPAGRVLWSCVDDAGISRDDVDATNAVKHFEHDLQLARRWSS